MSIEIQPYLDDPAAEMLQLGLLATISERAYLMARQDLLAGTIDAYELEATARRYQRWFRGC